MFKAFKNWYDKQNAKHQEKVAEYKELRARQKEENSKGNGGITVVLKTGQEIRLSAGESLIFMGTYTKDNIQKNKRFSLNGITVYANNISHYYQSEDVKVD
ncbi:hypothetical protein WAZ07_04275 [Bacillus sp. FJAT-51639]|uniref:Uncharacterized protein n=1 Tax=Bacillus bruguierae TaxID=3127667 RepID=A0ABU8FCZ0_9BACI